METLAALGLASNILSFVDFTWKLLAGAHEIYSSGDGAAQDVQFLDTITKDVQNHGRKIVAGPTATKELKSLAGMCDEITQDLLGSLDKLRIKGDKTRWNSFSAALKGVRSKKKVEQLTDKISKVQIRISAHMQELILDNLSSMGRTLKSLQLTHESLGIVTKDEVSSLRDEIHQTLEKFTRESSAIRTKGYFQQLHSQELSPVALAQMSNQMRGLASAMENLQAKGIEADSNQQLLKKLHFKSISTRERKIEKAHESTFQWLVDSGHQATRPKSGTDLVKWLRSGDGVFWIHGKPGSGKSTFMKFVCAQVVVEEHLKHWADGHQLVTSSFYFWYAGSRLQKSLEGLLRTLLFEILRHDPGVISVINNDPRIAGLVSYDEDWDVETLFQMYEIAVRHQEHAKFCFFVDGLDEFHDEDYKALGDLTSALHRLGMSDKIKLCVVSRSWTEFEDIYGHDLSKCLKLEDLTRDDIRSYVSDAFNNHQQFPRLRDNDQNYELSISEVVDRAQGVFLWVRLVVETLLGGLTFHESVQTLRRQVLMFPEDLEGFFHQMLKSIPSAYRLRAASALKVATEATRPRLLIFYHFLDEFIQDLGPVLDSSPAPLGPHDLTSIYEKMRRQVNGRFKGLLEVTTDKGVAFASTAIGAKSEYFGCRVDFLHRTVRDFLVSSQKAIDFFHSNIGSEADLSIACTKAAVAQIRFAKFATTNLNDFDQLACQLFFHARHAASLGNATNTLDDILDIAEELCCVTVQIFDWGKLSFCFAGLAAQSGLTSFLERKFKMGLSLVAVRDSEGRLPGLPKPAQVLESRDSLPKKQPESSTSFFTSLLRYRWKKPQDISIRFKEARAQPITAQEPASVKAPAHERWMIGPRVLPEDLGLGDARQQPVESVRKPLLNYALTPGAAFAAPSTTAVKLLISRGASPNETFRNTTVWEQFLASLDMKHEQAIRKEYFEITKSLLRSGAPLSSKVSRMVLLPNDLGQPRLERVSHHPVDRGIPTAHEVIKEYFTLDEVNQLIPSD